MNAIQQLVTEFQTKLVAVVREQVHTEIMSKLGTPKAKTGIVLKLDKPRKKGPVQLCPAPGCKNPAAPVFGMVCAKHKDVPKAQIAKWREARRAKKQAKATKPKLKSSSKPKSSKPKSLALSAKAAA